MDYEQKINELIKGRSLQTIISFLIILKQLYDDYLNKKIDDVTLSNITIYWSSTLEKFAKFLFDFEPKIKDLRTGIDITHPDLSNEKKEQIIRDLAKQVDELLEEYQMMTKGGVGESIADAIENKDETKLSDAIILAMQQFLEGKITKDDLDTLASYYLTIPIHEKWDDEFQFSNPKLRYVMMKLSAIEVVPDDEAETNVKRFILYLQNKDYEGEI